MVWHFPKKKYQSLVLVEKSFFFWNHLTFSKKKVSIFGAGFAGTDVGQMKIRERTFFQKITSHTSHQAIVFFLARELKRSKLCSKTICAVDCVRITTMKNNGTFSYVSSALKWHVQSFFLLFFCLENQSADIRGQGPRGQVEKQKSWKIYFCVAGAVRCLKNAFDDDNNNGKCFFRLNGLLRADFQKKNKNFRIVQNVSDLEIKHSSHRWENGQIEGFVLKVPRSRDKHDYVFFKNPKCWYKGGSLKNKSREKSIFCVAGAMFVVFHNSKSFVNTVFLVYFWRCKQKLSL